MVQVTLDSLSTMKSVDKAYITGAIKGTITAVGRKTRCTALEHSLGPMDDSTLETSLRIKRKVKEFFNGQMAASMTDRGWMVNNMG